MIIHTWSCFFAFIKLTYVVQSIDLSAITILFSKCLSVQNFFYSSWLSWCELSLNVDRFMQSENPCQLSWFLVKIHVSWVDLEWNSMSAESMWIESPCHLSQCEVRLHVIRVDVEWYSSPLSWCEVKLHVTWVDVEWDSMSAELMWSETPCQLSQCGVRFHVIWVNLEWDSMSPEWCGVRLYVSWVDVKWDSMSAKLMWSETPCHLNQCGVRFHVSLVNMDYWNFEFPGKF
jgi:hypothetical protein